MKFLLSSFIFLFFFNVAYALNEKAPSPSYKISIDAKLQSHFIDRGLSISDKNPALNASFLFNLGPQFRVGFWGSNISNLSYSDDNFWFKFVADVRVDFNQNSNLMLYLNDDHFYKSSVRNGQSVGLKYFYFLYMAELEWMNNYQGTHVNSEYVNLGKLFEFRPSLRVGGKIGYTLQNSVGLDNYFDAKALGIYDFNKNSSFEAGATMVTNENQFNGRGEPGFYVAVLLSY